MRAESALLPVEVKRSFRSTLPFFLLLLLAVPPAAQAHHSVNGWYAHGTSLVGPADTDAAACQEGEGMFKAMQAAQNPPPQNYLTNFSHIANQVCYWNTVAAGVGPYGAVALHDSAYFPALAYAPPMNSGCCPDLDFVPRTRRCAIV